jgi:S-adenosylmethionine:tRNA ribosyltransferase-isomerase
VRLGPGHVPRLISGILTGLHEPGESHFELLQAFAPKDQLERILPARGLVVFRLDRPPT